MIESDIEPSFCPTPIEYGRLADVVRSSVLREEPVHSVLGI